MIAGRTSPGKQVGADSDADLEERNDGPMTGTSLLRCC